MAEQRPGKSVTFNPVVSVRSVGTVDQAAERSSLTSEPDVAETTSATEGVGLNSSLLGGTGDKLPTAASTKVTPTGIKPVTGTKRGSNETARSPHPPSPGQTSEERDVPRMTYLRVQEDLNKFMIDLQRENALFLEQVKKVNNLSTVLESNNVKIANLHSKVDTLKKDHNRINDALIYIRNQQLEMEECLDRLESSMLESEPEMDPNRLSLYELATGIDQQLLGIGRDLKFVIDHINEANGVAAKSHCPVAAILKVLNEHTNMLSWAEESCDNVKKSLQTVHQEHQAVKKNRIVELRQI